MVYKQGKTFPLIVCSGPSFTNIPVKGQTDSFTKKLKGFLLRVILAFSHCELNTLPVTVTEFIYNMPKYMSSTDTSSTCLQI